MDHPAMISNESRHHPGLDIHHKQQHAHTPSPKCFARALVPPNDFRRTYTKPKTGPPPAAAARAHTFAQVFARAPQPPVVKHNSNATLDEKPTTSSSTRAQLCPSPCSRAQPPAMSEKHGHRRKLNIHHAQQHTHTSSPKSVARPPQPPMISTKLSQQRNPNRRGIWNSKRQIDVVTF